MREVETEVIRAYERTFLLHMCSENLTESLVEKMRRSMVVGDFQPSVSIHMQRE